MWHDLPLHQRNGIEGHAKKYFKNKEGRLMTRDEIHALTDEQRATIADKIVKDYNDTKR